MIPLKVVTVPGKKLKNLLTSSKPLDDVKCPQRNCITCKCLMDGKCTDRNVVYHIRCTFSECSSNNSGRYDGETYRPIRERFIEHYRSAKNPTAESYQDKPLARHYSSEHPNCQEPKLELTITHKASSTVDRKIKEARTILKNRSDLNNREEQTDLQNFLI